MMLFFYIGPLVQEKIKEQLEAFRKNLEDRINGYIDLFKKSLEAYDFLRAEEYKKRILLYKGGVKNHIKKEVSDKISKIDNEIENELNKIYDRFAKNDDILSNIKKIPTVNDIFEKINKVINNNSKYSSSLINIEEIIKQKLKKLLRESALTMEIDDDQEIMEKLPPKISIYFNEEKKKKIETMKEREEQEKSMEIFNDNIQKDCINTLKDLYQKIDKDKRMNQIKIKMKNGIVERLKNLFIQFENKNIEEVDPNVLLDIFNKLYNYNEAFGFPEIKKYYEEYQKLFYSNLTNLIDSIILLIKINKNSKQDLLAAEKKISFLSQFLEIKNINEKIIKDFKEKVLELFKKLGDFLEKSRETSSDIIGSFDINKIKIESKSLNKEFLQKMNLDL